MAVAPRCAWAPVAIQALAVLVMRLNLFIQCRSVICSHNISVLYHWGVTVRLEHTSDPGAIVICTSHQAIGLRFQYGAVDFWVIVTTARLKTWWEQPPRYSRPVGSRKSGIRCCLEGRTYPPKWRKAIAFHRCRLDQRLDGITSVRWTQPAVLTIAGGTTVCGIPSAALNTPASDPETIV